MIKPRSTRMQKLMRAYNKAAKTMLSYYPEGYQIHHKLGRAGTLLLDERFWIPVTAELHDWIHKNPNLARDAGLLCEKGQWNVAPNDYVTEEIRQRMIEICKK